MKQNFRRKLAWSTVPVMLAGGLAATGLASAQSTTTTSPQETTTTTAPTAPTPRVFFATAPTRMLDTRYGLGGTHAGPLGAGGQIDLQVAGVGPVPANATGAAVNVTVFGETQESFLTVWPTGQSQPGTSLLNPQPNLVLSQAASIGLGGGKLSIFNAAGSTHVVVDLVGYYQDTSDVPSLSGVAHFLTGTADPTSDQGVVGDMYINNKTNSLFGPKTANGWGAATRLGGAQFSTGTTDPTPDIGGLGDMYINTATNTLFGPKTASGWGTGNAMGAHFVTGTTDPTAAQGIVGDVYLNTVSNVLFGPKTAAGWGTGDSLSPAFRTAASANGYAVQPTFATVTGSVLSLPPGKWFIQAKGNNNQGTASQIDVRIQNTTANTTVDTTSLFTPGAMRIPFSVGGAVTLTANANFELQALTTAAGAGTIDNAKIYATQISSINGS